MIEIMGTCLVAGGEKKYIKSRKREKTEKRKGGKENKCEKRNEKFPYGVYKMFESSQYSKPVKFNDFC